MLQAMACAQALPAAPCSGRRQVAAAAAAAAAACCPAQPRLWRAPARRPGSSSSGGGASGRQQRIALAAAAVPAEAAELEAEGQQQWAAAAALLQERCGLEPEAADAALLKAFGWKGQAFWRQERVRQAPCPAQVASSLDYLEGLGVGGEALGPLVAAFPEVLGLRLEVMQGNVQVLRDKWYLKGATLTNAIKRKPRVLGNVINCTEEGEGACAGLCTRCWAQF